MKKNTYKAFPDASNDAAPCPGPIIVDKSLLPSNVFSGPPTRDRSSPPCEKRGKTLKKVMFLEKGLSRGIPSHYKRQKG